MTAVAPGWWSEPVAATGSAKSDGIRKQLGAPKMDRLTVLVRESAQNSWDARSNPAGGVRYGIALSKPDDTLINRWRSLFCPEPEHSRLGVDDLLQPGGIVLAVVSDRGTEGLGGPLRADEVEEGAPGADFVNLLRNIGEPRDKAFGGGTYGFGKGVLFTASRVGTILVRTRCRVADGFQTRLIGASLGTGYHHGGKAHTGRHWWGDVTSGIPDPVLDEEADAICSYLGLTSIPAHETGTDIVILGLEVGTLPAADDGPGRPRSLEQVADHLASAMMWNLWPLMLADDGAPRLDCRVSIDGVDVPVPRAEQEPSARPFVEAYRALTVDPTVISRKKPKTDLGLFAAKTHVASRRSSRATVAAPFSGNAHHCARMREPRLIVDYLEGPPMADDVIHYGAVFLAAKEHDHAFAEAEPPTHDDWVAQKVEDADERSIVNVAQREIKTNLAAFVERAQGAAPAAGEQPPLGALSSRLAALIPTATGPGADGLTAAGAGGGGASAAKARLVTQPRMVRRDGTTLIVAEIEVAAAARTVEVVAVATVVLDTGREDEPPVGADLPKVLGFRDQHGQVRDGDTLLIEPDDERRWTVLVRPAGGAAAKLKVSAS